MRICMIKGNTSKSHIFNGELFSMPTRIPLIYNIDKTLLLTTETIVQNGLITT